MWPPACAFVDLWACFEKEELSEAGLYKHCAEGCLTFTACFRSPVGLIYDVSVASCVQRCWVTGWVVGQACFQVRPVCLSACAMRVNLLLVVGFEI